jgi:hypothetical protein
MPIKPDAGKSQAKVPRRFGKYFGMILYVFVRRVRISLEFLRTPRQTLVVTKVSFWHFRWPSRFEPLGFGRVSACGTAFA